MDKSEITQIQQFYKLTHWGRLFFMILLAAVFIGTTGQAVWEMAQSVRKVTGIIQETAETRPSTRSATYTLVIRDDQGELDFLRLRNNGRILNYLLAQEDFPTRRVTVNMRQGTAISLSFFDGDEIVINESRLYPSIKLLIGLIPLFILIFHVRPSLVERQV